QGGGEELGEVGDRAGVVLQRAHQLGEGVVSAGRGRRGLGSLLRRSCRGGLLPFLEERAPEAVAADIGDGEASTGPLLGDLAARDRIESGLDVVLLRFLVAGEEVRGRGADRVLLL